MKDTQYKKPAKFLLKKLRSLAKEQGDEIMLDKINSAIFILENTADFVKSKISQCPRCQSFYNSSVKFCGLGGYNFKN